MFELDFYVVRALGVTAALLDLHDLFFCPSAEFPLDCAKIREILNTYQKSNTPSISIPSCMLKVPEHLGLVDYTKVDWDALLADQKVQRNEIVMLGLFYLYGQDALAQIQICRTAWQAYAQTPSFEDPCVHFTNLCDQLLNLLQPFVDKCSKFIRSVHAAVQEQDADLVTKIYAQVARLVGLITAEYTMRNIST